MPDDDFFIGWADMPAPDRRFFLKAGAGLMLGTGGLAAGAALFQKRPGPGTWDAAAEREWTGLLLTQPYPMLRTRNLDGLLRTALISCAGKCGGQQLLQGMAGGYVGITGSLVARGQHALISVTEAGPWLRRLETPSDALPQAPEQVRGRVSLEGEILDSKCWFGAMRPSSGKVHKACASLCIRGGIPPAFFAKNESGNTAMMVMTDGQNAFGADILPFVADPVRVEGEVVEAHGIAFLRTSVAQIERRHSASAFKT